MINFQTVFGLRYLPSALLRALAAPAKRNTEFDEVKALFEHRGLTLSEEQWPQLIDLANGTGKSLSELAYAIMDAMTGENERLKCFGPQGRIIFDRIKQRYSGNNI